MSNAILYCVNEINNTIPREILHAAFTIDEIPEVSNLTTLDEKIIRKLIKKRVMMDTNILGGIETIIPLNNISPMVSELYYTIYNIPPELTMNKEIISTLSIITTAGNMYYPIANTSNSLTNTADRIGNSFSPNIMSISNAHTEIVGYNTILIYCNYRLLLNYGLRVILENDNNLNNLSPRSYKSFSMMCVLAAKAYIYNKLIIPINSGYLSAGQDLGIFKSIIEGYSDAEEQYRTYLNEKIGSLLYMNDTTRYNRLLGSMISPDL